MRAGALFVLLLACGLATEARAALPGDLSGRIADAVADGRGEVSREAARAAQIGDPELSRMMATRAREHATDMLCAVVIGGIAENPQLAGEIVASAQAAAPELATDVQRRVAEAYPFLGTPMTLSPAPPARTPEASAPRPRAVEPFEPSGPPPATDALPERIYDPFEDVNRGIFAFNDVFDRFLLRPIAWSYGKVMPERAKTAVRNFFRNLGSPVRFANDGLQGEASDAGYTFMRFMINTTVGVGGLFEVAEDWGFPYKPSDFGQTMHRYGVNAGPYLVVPFLGPSTARDVTGLVVDAALDPLTWLVDTKWNAAVLGGRMVTTREHLIEPLDEMEKGSLDYYAALRSAVYQDRAVELRRGVVEPFQNLDKDFDAAQ